MIIKSLTSFQMENKTIKQTLCASRKLLISLLIRSFLSSSNAKLSDKAGYNITKA